MKKNLIFDADMATTIMAAAGKSIREWDPTMFTKSDSREIVSIHWDSLIGKTIIIFNMAENVFFGNDQYYRIHRYPSCL
jgi:hypothetical protein